MIASVSGTSFADYLTAINGGNTQHATIAFPSQSITLDEHRVSEQGIEYQLLLNSEQDLTIGMAPCAMVHMYLLNYDGSLSSIDYTDEFTVSLGVEISNGATPPTYTNTPQTIGYFIGQKPQKVNQKIIELTGYDRMILFEKPAEAFFQQEANGKTAAEYFDDLCTYVGVTAKAIPVHAVNSSKYFATHPTTGIGMTCRNVLAYLAELMGCYARIAADGECELVWFENHTSDYTVQRNQQMEEPDVAEFTVPVIDKYQVKVTENDVGVIVGSGTNGYITIDNPFLYGNSDNEIRPYATDIYNKIHAFAAYKPGTFQVDGTWLVEPGDIITVVLENGSTMPFPIFNVSYVWNGSANIVYETTGQNERTELTLENSQRLQEGYKFHELHVDVDGLISTIGDRTGKTTTIAQDIDHVELVASQKSSVWVSLTDPALDNVVNEGDIWIKQEFENWQDVNDNVSSWNALNDGVRIWASLYSGEAYYRINNKWLRMTMNEEALSSIDGLRTKYDIQSGIEIKPEGIEIRGGKYINIKSNGDFNVESGGTFNVQSPNFVIDNVNKVLDIRTGQIYLSGTNFLVDSNNKEFVTGNYRLSSYGFFATMDGDNPNSLHFKIRSGKSSDNFDTVQFSVTEDSVGETATLNFTPFELWPNADNLIELGKPNYKFNAVFLKNLWYTNQYQNSSRDIKHNIVPLLPQGEKLDKLEPVTFVYDNDMEEKQRAGLIYEDTVDIMPEICTNDESNKAINYVELVPYLLKEIQELRARVKALEEREVN